MATKNGRCAQCDNIAPLFQDGKCKTCLLKQFQRPEHKAMMALVDGLLIQAHKPAPLDVRA